jgi:translation initiation factor IF-2
MVNLNSKIDFETSAIIAESFNINLERDKSWWINVEDIIKWNLADLLLEDDITKLKDRPPVISIMWHVDHGKTSLLDYIRQEKVAEWEAGGITQSIWAYQVVKNGKKITFLDTPWHEAFTIMRARWAKSTDIAILVVAADEWVKPQTIESINHAKEAWISIIVAMNKMDKEWANPDHLKSQLAEHWIISEEWWGDVPMVPVSAKTWFWIDDLLEIILLVAEMKELKANPDRLWVWTIIESHLDMKYGPVATVLINSWSISIWDNIVSKQAFWKVKVLKDYKSKHIKIAHPWDPVLIVWLDEVANGWDILQVVPTAELARDKSLEYRSIMMNQKHTKLSSLDMIMSKIKSWTLKNLKVVVKADTNGSLEAIKWALLKLATAETKVSVIHSWVWNITEWDVLMCSWGSAILIWFWVDVLWTAKKSIDSMWVEFISSNIIYKITEKIEKIVTWMLDPKEIETVFWNATVLSVFYTSKEFMIVWLKIKDEEKIENKLKLRVIRKQKLVWKWEILSLKRWVEEIKSLEWPIECWIKFSWNVVLEEGDILEMYKVEIQK